MSMFKMESCYSSFTKQLTSTLPQLASHFSRLGLRPDLYLLDWIMTLYSRWGTRSLCVLSICDHGRSCPLDVTCRLWDLIIRDGEAFLLKTALGLLSLYEEALLKETDFVRIAQFLSKLPDDINCDRLFERIEVCWYDIMICILFQNNDWYSDYKLLDLEEGLPQSCGLLVRKLWCKEIQYLHDRSKLFSFYCDKFKKIL